MNKQKVVFTLLNRKTLEKLKKEKFSGKLRIEWKEGLLTCFDLSTRITVSKRDKKDLGWLFDFGEDEED